MSRGVAVVGMGRWGKVWSTVLHQAGVTLVTSTDAGARRDFRETISRSDADAVVITLPVSLHREAVELAASLGKPVLCEKPAVATRSELASLSALARTHPVIRVCQNYRAREWAISAKAAIAHIGVLHSVSIEFAQAEFLDGGRGDLRHPLLADLSIHHVDLLRWLTDQEARVRDARSVRAVGSQYQGDTDVVALLELDSGAAVTYAASWASGRATTPWDANWRFRGEHGVVTVTNGVVMRDTHDGPPHVWSAEEAENADLANVWTDFEAAIEGRSGRFDAAVSIQEHARSLNLVFEMSAAAGVDAPHLQVVGK